MRVEARLTRRKRLSLTSLIDVIFLLLLFFMLSSTFSRFSQVEIAQGTAAAAAGQPDAILSLSLDGLRLNGEETDGQGLPGRLAGLKDAGAQRVLLIVSQDALTQDFVTATQAVARAGLAASVAKAAP